MRYYAAREMFYYLIKKKGVSRRAFIKGMCGLVGILMTWSLLPRKLFAGEYAAARPSRRKRALRDLAVIKGGDPYQITVKAIDALGGMERFVKRNATVVIKPNMAWDRYPEQAANTNPMVVAALVDLCFNAGARRVNVFDRTCNSAKRCYRNSGIEEAAVSRGASVYFVDSWNYIKAHFSYPSPMEGWPVYRDAVECDTFISAPVLKHHSLAGLTISMKNLMGICGGERGLIHQDIGLKLAHLTDFIKPDLTVVDAYRVLVKNGPSGGNIEDVRELRTVIAGEDPVLADSYAAHIFGRDPLSLSYIREGRDMGLGKADITAADIFTGTA